MESTGSNGRRGPWSYYREQPGSYSYNSSSGTVSTAYTSTSFRLSWMSMEAARHFQEMEMEDPVSMEMKAPVSVEEAPVSWEKEAPVSTEMKAIMDFKFVQSQLEKAREKQQKMKQIKILVEKFFGAPSAKCSVEGGDLSVLVRWFTELGVGWVLHVVDGAPAGELAHALDASSWFPGLAEIIDTFCLTLGLLPVHGSMEEQEPATESDEEQNMAEQLQLASFTQQAMLKMLTFVDFIVAPNLTCEVFIDDGLPVPPPYDKIHTLIRVLEALSKALSKIRMSLYSSSFAEVARIQREVVNVLSVKEGKVRGAIWSAVEIRTRTLESLDDGQGSSGTQNPQGSSDIHKATRSIMMYVMLLQHDHSLVAPIVSEAARLGKYGPRVGDLPPLTSLVVEMVSCLEVKLANKSEAFPDQGLRFLFLLNNSVYIEDKLHCAPNFPESYKVNLADKVEGYIERYIQVSWAPVLSCLVNLTPICLGKNYSPLPKFESEFQKVYTTQKLWKVPNSELRKRLRKAIRDKVVPSYTRYLADYYGNAPLNLSPSYMQEMIQELFEG